MTKDRIIALDGIRAIGILFIIAGHLKAFGLLNVQELIGNYVFFLLSGFFAVLFAKEEKFCSYKYIAAFYLKRFMKIMPLLAVSCVLYAFVYPDFNALGQLTFTNTYGTVWFVAQLMLFWLVQPLLMLVISFLKQKWFIPNFFLGVAIFFLNFLCGSVLGNEVFFISQNVVSPWRIDCILYGVALGYICRSTIVERVIQKRNIQVLFCLLWILLLIILVLASGLFNILSFTAEISFIYIPIFMIFTFFTYFTGKHFSGKILGRKPLTLIGQQSYGLMLFHLPLHELLPFNGNLHFFFVLAVALLLSLLCDFCIVKPINRVALSVAQDMEHTKGFDPVSILVLMLLGIYLSAAYLTAHNKEYVLNQTVGFSGYSTTGLRNIVGGIGKPLATGSPIKEKALLEFRFEDTPYDLMAVFGFDSIEPNSQIAIYVDGDLLESQSADEMGYIRFLIPNMYTQDNKLSIEFDISGDAILSSAKLLEERTYQLGTELTFTKQMPIANSYFDYGLKPAEDTATWAQNGARMRLPLSEKPDTDLTLSLNWAALDTHAQRMIVLCGGVEIFQGTFEYENATMFIIPDELITGTELLLEFQFPDACPNSFAFTSMNLEKVQRYVLGETLSFRAGEATANAFFSYGLGAPEDNATWAKGAGSFTLPLASEVTDDLAVTLSWAAVDTHAQRMVVICQGETLLDEQFEDIQTTTFVIPQTLVENALLHLDFQFPDACPSSFAFTEMRVEAVT